MADLVIEGLRAEIDGKEILKGIDLEVSKGEIHAVMGPNGSGKSTLVLRAHGPPGLRGHGRHACTFKGVDLLELEPDERSRLGMFLAFQYPHADPGVTVDVASCARRSTRTARAGPRARTTRSPSKEFAQQVPRARMEMLQIDQSLSSRYLNDGFSGGEKKRVEILQMAMLKPELAILDETDSGLDIDALQDRRRGRQHAGRAPSSACS